jgi:hypothetical protein
MAQSQAKHRETISDLTVQAREAILAEKRAKKREKDGRETAQSHRLKSGRHLLDLKTMIDDDPTLADGQTFWVWFDYWFVKEKLCSRKDAEKRIALALADDPEAALAEERRKAREGMAAHRAKEAPANNADVSGSKTQQNQGGAAQKDTGDKAQKATNVVSLHVKPIVDAIRALTKTERDQLYSQLRKDGLL